MKLRLCESRDIRREPRMEMRLSPTNRSQLAWTYDDHHSWATNRSSVCNRTRQHWHNFAERFNLDKLTTYWESKWLLSWQEDITLNRKQSDREMKIKAAFSLFFNFRDLTNDWQLVHVLYWWNWKMIVSLWIPQIRNNWPSLPLTFCLRRHFPPPCKHVTV